MEESQLALIAGRPGWVEIDFREQGDPEFSPEMAAAGEIHRFWSPDGDWFEVILAPVVEDA